MEMLKQQIISEIGSVIQHIFKDNNVEWSNDLQIQMEQPSRSEHGDYASNIAMQLAKILRRAPIQIANDIVSRLQDRDSFQELVEQVKVVPPGFINFFLSWQAFLKVGEKYVPPVERMGEKVIVEHTSINPNKAAHIGHLRNSCIGDMIGRLYRRTGYQVEVHNYIDDLGNQLADTVVGLMNVPLEQEYVRFSDYCWDIYARVNQVYKQDDALQGKRAEVLHALEAGDNNVAWQGILVAERIVRDHLGEMAEFHIDYDLLVWESNIVRNGFWAAAFEILKQSDQFVKETEGKLAGCWVLKQSSEENDIEEADHQQDKVLVRSNGILTYTAKDIAYHMWKFGLLSKDFVYRPFTGHIWTTASIGEVKSYGHADKVLNVIDTRQEYPQAMVKLALETVGYEQAAANLEHVSYGVVSLSPATAEMLGIDTSDAKSSYTMSGRQGIGIKISELLDRMEQVIEEKRTRKTGIPSREIATAAVRYYLLRFGLNTEIVFDMQQATEVSGNTGVYLLYSYARGHNILKKADVSVFQVPVDINMSDLHPAERAILRQIITWPDVIEASLRELAPNLICNYGFELTSFFNNFYAVCPVLQEGDEKKRNFRLWLTSIYTKNLADVLGIIGLPTPTEM
jgi:arginyl-tRNA synthetase